MSDRSVGELKAWLAQFPDNFRVWGYEGEVVGIVVQDTDFHGLRDWVFYNAGGEDKREEPNHEQAYPER